MSSIRKELTRARRIVQSSHQRPALETFLDQQRKATAKVERVIIATETAMTCGPLSSVISESDIVDCI